MNTIEQAVNPLKQASIDAAEQNALQFLAAVKSKLEAAGWDIDLVAVAPSIRMNRAQYVAAKTYRDVVRSFVTSANCSRRRSEPNIVIWSDEYAAKFVESTKQDAAFQYEAYVCKLVKKVGDAIKAEMVFVQGLWNNSILVVTKADGTEKWNTKCIVNRSVYGKLFNQFPTRKLA